MIRSDQHSGREVSLAEQVVGWLAIMAIQGLNYGLSWVPLGEAKLPVQLALATVNLGIITWWFMHLAEEKGTRRFALPTAIGFLLLLLSIVMLDVATRFPPANPNAVQKELMPRRPLPSRTAPPGAQPFRLPGQ